MHTDTLIKPLRVVSRCFC